MDNVISNHLLQHLRVVDFSQKFQLTNDLVRNITKEILEEDAISYWASEVKAEPEQDGYDVLLNGGKILVRCFIENGIAYVGEGYAELTIEKLFLGFKQWILRSTEYVSEQIDSMNENEIYAIDEIGINEICQYAIFNDLLCDL